MTGGRPRRVRAVLGNRFTLWLAFVLVHLYLGYQNLYSPSYPMGDVSVVYKEWMDQAVGANYWVGIDSSWVYPIVALLPMLASYAFGPALYSSTWLSLVMVLDAAALATLTGWGRTPKRLAAGWWWVLFLVLLGPIAIGRLDAVSVAVAMVGILLLARHTTAAGVLITIATWIKVWPVAIVGALIIAVKQRSAVIGSVIGTSVGIVVIALAFGSGANVFSFVGAQTGRGLQAEAPVATIWMWRAFAHVPGTTVYFDGQIIAWQVVGRGVQLASAIMTPLMAVAVIAVAVLGIRGVRRGMPVAQLLPLLSLGFATALIVFNKVGSPQYVAWLAVPIVLALATGGSTRRLFLKPAAIVLVLAGLTQMIYPYFYAGVIGLHPAMLVVLTVRNVLLVVLFGWSVVALVRGARGGAEEWESARSARAFQDAPVLAPPPPLR